MGRGAWAMPLAVARRQKKEAETKSGESAAAEVDSMLTAKLVVVVQAL